MNARSQIAIVGGGLAGLTAATVAARAGADVTLFEGAAAPGGRAATVSRDGVLLNIGPHALYNAGAATRILRSLGVEWTGGQPSVGGYALVGGRRRKLPVGPVSLLSSGSLSARGKVEFGRVFSGLRRIDTAALRAVTLQTWLAETFQDASARKAMAALTRVATYGNAPDIASAGAAIEQLNLAGPGVTYIDGGWQTLVAGLTEQASASGVTIESGSRVTSVAPSTDGWRVRAGGDSRRFDVVILAVSPALAAELYPSNPLRCWAEEAVPVRAAVLDIVLPELPNPAGRFALGFDQPTYLSVHSAVAKLAQPGRVLVTTAWYRRPGDSLSDAEIEAGLERSLDLVQPGWRETVLFRRYLPDLAVTGDYVRAATAGYECRPGPEVPGSPGFFVAGDWVGREGMLADAAISSGARAGELAAAAHNLAERATLVAAR